MLLLIGLLTELTVWVMFVSPLFICIGGMAYCWYINTIFTECNTCNCKCTYVTMDARSTSHTCMYVCNYVGPLVHLRIYMYVVMYRPIRADKKVKNIRNSVLGQT